MSSMKDSENITNYISILERRRRILSNEYESVCYSQRLYFEKNASLQETKEREGSESHLKNEMTKAVRDNVWNFFSFAKSTLRIAAAASTGCLPESPELQKPNDNYLYLEAVGQAFPESHLFPVELKRQEDGREAFVVSGFKYESREYAERTVSEVSAKVYDYVQQLMDQILDELKKTQEDS